MSSFDNDDVQRAPSSVAPSGVPQPNDAARSIDGTPTPGGSLAGLRIAGAPTHPDFDPASMMRAISQMANMMFQPASSTIAPSETSTLPIHPPVIGTSATAADAPPTATPTDAQPRSTSPFDRVPNFDSLVGDVDDMQGFSAMAALLRVPLLDEQVGDETPLIEAQPFGTTPEATLGHDVEPPSTTVPPPDPIFTLTPDVELGSSSRQVSRNDGLNAHAVRKEFPILDERVHGKRLVWLDSAATTQKPRVVIDRISHFYEHENSNIHRAAHTLAARATDAYENARDTVKRFVNASSVDEIIFVRGATEGINLIAKTYGARHVEAGDEIVITWLEHHANIVPWQQLCQEKGAKLRVAPVDDSGQILLDEFERLMTSRTKIVAFPIVSNALGTVTPANEMVEIAHRYGAVVVVDGAQSVSHRPTDVAGLDCDFFVFSGHKVFAPTGIGVVYGKRNVLAHMPPWQGGGNMIVDVTFEKTVFQNPPARFEAGTGNIADAVGLGAALDWLMRLGVHNVEHYEHELLCYATERLAPIPGLRIIGTAKEKAGVLSFVLKGYDTHEVSTYLDSEGIAVRGGHHCAQPILRRFGVESTVRASFAVYNGKDDVDVLETALRRLIARSPRV